MQYVLAKISAPSDDLIFPLATLTERQLVNSSTLDQMIPILWKHAASPEAKDEKTFLSDFWLALAASQGSFNDQLSKYLEAAFIPFINTSLSFENETMTTSTWRIDPDNLVVLDKLIDALNAIRLPNILEGRKSKWTQGLTISAMARFYEQKAMSSLAETTLKAKISQIRKRDLTSDQKLAFAARLRLSDHDRLESLAHTLGISAQLCLDTMIELTAEVLGIIKPQEQEVPKKGPLIFILTRDQGIPSKDQSAE